MRSEAVSAVAVAVVSAAVLVVEAVTSSAVSEVSSALVVLAVALGVTSSSELAEAALQPANRAIMSARARIRERTFLLCVMGYHPFCNRWIFLLFGCYGFIIATPD